MRSSKDVIRALDESRRRQAQTVPVREAYAATRMSRIGRVVSLLAAAKSALRGTAEPFPALLESNPELAAVPAITWPAEARDAAERQIAALENDMAQYRTALDEARAAAASFAMERDRNKATHFLLRTQLKASREEALRSRAAVEEAEASYARFEQIIAALRRKLTAAEDALRAVTNQRNAEYETVALLGAALKRLQAERDCANQQVRTLAGPAFPEELSAQRARLVATLGGQEEKLGSHEPVVSVIIPAYGQAKMTLDCLISIGDAVAGGPTMQIIVVDDASTDNHFGPSLSGIPYVTLLRNGTNLGFLRSCNRAAGIATGTYLHFLNNDTIVHDGWLRELVACAEADGTIGAVGSKLLFADGSLQEAGGIIWRDASGWNYGRDDDPEDAKYNYVRDVDYISGASLLVRRELFENLNRFDTRYAPAYFEDSDLCFSIRKSGYRVVYQPKSVVVHLEGASSGTSVTSGVKRHQVLNAPKFAQKWHSELQRHFEPGSASGIQAARRLQKPKTLVMIDNYVPEYDKDSGSNKLFNFIKLYIQLGYNVIFVPQNYHRSEPYTTVLQNLGVEVLYATERSNDLDTALRDRLAIADVVWMGRPDIGERFLPIVREYPALPVLYDTHDLHYVRERRELELKGVTDPDKWAAWERTRDLELQVVRSADVAMTVTDVEKRVLEEAGMTNVFVMPNVHDSFGRSTPFERTSGVIFIGGYAHSPNVDAVIWLCGEIMPLVWRTHPDIVVTLIGSNAPDVVRALASDRVIVTGFVENVVPYFERARLMVAPLRYGAGLKGKIGHAFAHALPTVTTPIGAEGFELVEGRDALVADDAAGFAKAMVRAYDDPALWKKLSDGGAQLVKRFSPEATKERLAAATALAYARRAAAHAASPK